MGNACKRCLIRFGCEKQQRPPNREIVVGKPDFNDQLYPQNEVKSSRYTGLNFLPKCIFEQFQRIANYYFLCISIIQLFIESPTSPLTSIVPLLVVVGVSVVKQGYEDILRHRADDEINNKLIDVFRGDSIVQIKSRTIVIGDIIRCHNDDMFPCDMLILSSSEASGECFVTTASLDGETNLKIFSALHNTRSVTDCVGIVEMDAHVVCQEPIEDLYRFVGRMQVNTDTYPLNTENILLRGARLKNTDFVLGCAIYTGFDTKLALNSKDKVNKFSKVELKLNQFLIIYLCILFGLSAFCTSFAFGATWILEGVWYLDEVKTTAWKIVQDFLGFVVIFSYFVPISLYVTIELQKFIGSMFFGFDLEMVDSDNDGIMPKANTSDLNEELGQVQYLFSDKTGTLTENCMKFRNCSVGGLKYFEKDDTIFQQTSEEECVEVDQQLNGDLIEFLRVLSICHTARLNLKEDGEREYNASSPDEKAFLEFCARHDIIYEGVENDVSKVCVNGVLEKHTVVQVLEFDSERKCMSVIVKHEDDTYHVYCKGAETTLIPKAARNTLHTDVIMQHVTDYALDGLRTLVIGSRKLSEKELKHLLDNLKDARNSLEDRDRAVNDAMSLIESNLQLLGCSAVEDRLQEGVPETIQDLRRAGIKVWILTGDKVETAVNISYSAGHFTTGILEVRITGATTPQDCHAMLTTQTERISATREFNKKAEFGLILDGVSLVHAFQFNLRTMLVSLMKDCTTVLCCRMTPLQKAEIVTLVRENIKPEPITAAIGDGANDVSMIMEAHVGLGLFGKEGRQAVRASDFAFTKFRFLRQAFFVHGFWYYTRIAWLIQYFFYKNLTFITQQFYFSIFSAFSAQTLFNSYYLMMYNMTLTSLVVLTYGLMEQVYPAKVLLAKPELYQSIRNNERLSWFHFIIWNLTAIWHSLVIYFPIHLLLYRSDVISTNGTGIDLLTAGTLFLCSVVIIVTVKLLLESYFFHVGVVIIMLITVICNLIFLLALNISYYPTEDQIYWSWFFLYSQPASWLVLILTPMIAFLPDIIYKIYRDSNRANILNLEAKPTKEAMKQMVDVEDVIMGKENAAYQGTL